MPVFYYTYHYNVCACLKLIPNTKCTVINTASAFSGKEVLRHPKSVPDIPGSWGYPTDASRCMMSIHKWTNVPQSLGSVSTDTWLDTQHCEQHSSSGHTMSRCSREFRSKSSISNIFPSPSAKGMTQTRDLDITGPSLSWQELMNKETATTSDAPLPFPRHIPLQLTAVALTLSCFRRRRAVDRWSAGVVRSDYITHLFPWGTSGYTSHNFHSAEAQGKQESNGFEEFVRQGALVIWGPAKIFAALDKDQIFISIVDTF